MSSSNADDKDSANNDDTNLFDKISADTLIMIISHNIDHDAIETLTDLKTVSKQFYNALNPNNGAVNMIWKEICRIKYPNTPQTLKIKRWDQFLKYRMMTISQRKKDDDDYKIFADKDPQDSVIVNCSHDIEEINNNLYSGDNTMFDGNIGNNFLPKGYEWKLQCPVLSDKLKKIDDQTKYCTVCKKNVYNVHTEKELQTRVENKECVSMTIFSGISYRRFKVRGRVRPMRYDRDNDEVDPYKDRRKDERSIRMNFTRYVNNGKRYRL